MISHKRKFAWYTSARDVITPSGLRPVFVFCAVLSVLLIGAPLASGQQLPKLFGQKNSGPAKSSPTGLPGSDEEIDREIERIKARLDKIQLDARSTGTGAPDESSFVPGAEPDELIQRERMMSELMITLEKQRDILTELKAIRKNNADSVMEQASWKGFSEKPPYSIFFLDDIRDSILSQRLALETFQIRHSFAVKLRAQFDKDLKKSRKDLRLAEEESTKSMGSPREQKSRWLLDLTRLRNDLNQAGLVLAEMQRLTLETAIHGKREQIAFFERKLRIGEASSPLSKEDLGKKLYELDSQRRDLQAELIKTQKVAEESRKKLELIRDAMSRVPMTSAEKEPSRGLFNIFKRSPEQKRETARAEKLRILKLDHDAEQILLETALQKMEVIKGQIQIVNSSEKIWQDRFWLTQNPDLKQIREKLADISQRAEDLKLVKKYGESRLASWLNLIRNEKERIATLKKADAERQIHLLILEAYEERQDIALRLIETAGKMERLINRLDDELTRKIEEASVSSRLKDVLQTASSFIENIWNTELYVAEETTIVEDRSIVKPVSVTIGKIVKALLILLVGTFIAGKIGRVIQWSMTKKLEASASKAEQISKVMFMLMFVGVFVFSLVSVNIPLAVFAFLGGALAIGIGFGAQHLINNFISGLILLFDRSIRVGDIVEVDGEGGRVTAVGMRYARIQRFDGIELMVPNSQFLQQKVTNWTLTDRRIRYKVSVGVAYGSPTRETERVIMKAIETHPRVLSDPPPTILFEEFGDSALIFTAYFWMELISNRDNRIALSDIRHAIDELLEKAGIVISFPQRDVHLDSSKPLEVKVVSPASDGKTQQ